VAGGWQVVLAQRAVPGGVVGDDAHPGALLARFPMDRCTLELDDVPPNVSFLHVADALCDASRCPGAVGNVLVHLDDNHVSASYATSMSGLPENDIVAALDPDAQLSR
jgi:hypothetical protein